jgi:hypothetical protein
VSCELGPTNQRRYRQHSGAPLGDVEGFFGGTDEVAPDGTLSAQIEVTDHLGGSFLNFEPVPSLKFTLDLTGQHRSDGWHHGLDRTYHSTSQ